MRGILNLCAVAGFSDVAALHRVTRIRTGLGWMPAELFLYEGRTLPPPLACSACQEPISGRPNAMQRARKALGCAPLCSRCLVDAAAGASCSTLGGAGPSCREICGRRYGSVALLPRGKVLANHSLRQNRSRDSSTSVVGTLAQLEKSALQRLNVVSEPSLFRMTTFSWRPDKASS